MPPPPVFQALWSSFQVSLPGSPGLGTTYQRHNSLPVLTSSAATHLVPHDLASVAVDRDDPAVRQVGDHEVFPERDAARARSVALVLDARIGDPDELALVGIARVDLVDGAPAVGRIHETVVDQRIDLVFRAVLPDVLHAAQRDRPDEPEDF